MRPSPGFSGLSALVLAVLLGGSLGAEAASPLPSDTPAPAPAATAPALTPRQALQQAEALFAQGHIFDAKELTALADLRKQLVDTGDSDRAADLDLLILGSQAKADSLAAEAKETLKIREDTDQWNHRVTFEQNRNFWKAVRDTGLATFTVSTVATLLLAVVNDRDQQMTSNSNGWNQSRQDFNNGLGIALAGTSSAMLLSLFPLLWGEARQ